MHPAPHPLFCSKKLPSLGHPTMNLRSLILTPELSQMIRLITSHLVTVDSKNNTSNPSLFCAWRARQKLAHHFIDQPSKLVMENSRKFM